MPEYGNGEAIDTEQFRNVQESERYGIHVSGSKIKLFSHIVKTMNMGWHSPTVK